MFWREILFAEVESHLYVVSSNENVLFLIRHSTLYVKCPANIVDLQPVNEHAISTKCFCKLTPFVINILPLNTRLAIHDTVDDVSRHRISNFQTAKFVLVCLEHCYLEKKKRLRRYVVGLEVISTGQYDCVFHLRLR